MLGSSEGSVVRILCLATFITTGALLVPATAAQRSQQRTPPSPDPSSSSLPPGVTFQAQEKLGKESKDHHMVRHIQLDDYGIWNPSPYSGGAHSSPVPHSSIQSGRELPTSVNSYHPPSSPART